MQALNTPVIAHATDLHPDGGVAFVHSVALARDMSAQLYTIHAGPLVANHRPMPDADATMMRWASATGQEAGQRVKHHKVSQVCCEDAVESLLSSLKEIKPDLLVVGTHQQKGLRRLFKGSVSEALAENLQLPTLFLPIGKEGFVDAQTGHMELRHVLIPAARESDALTAVAALMWLIEAMELSRLTVTLLHVGVEPVLSELRLPEREGLVWRRERRHGELTPTLLNAASELDAQLIVMPTRGQDGLMDILMGSHTEQLIRESALPVLSVPMNPVGGAGSLLGRLSALAQQVAKA